VVTIEVSEPNYDFIKNTPIDNCWWIIKYYNDEWFPNDNEVVVNILGNTIHFKLRELNQ
jgi:hypothetical protein